MHLIPLADRVLIDPIANDQMTAGGLLLPEGAEGRPYRGVVQAVGSKVKDVKPGDKVIFSKYAGGPFKFEGKSVHLITEENVLAIE